MAAAYEKSLAGGSPWAVFGIGTAFFLLSQFYRAAVAVITPQLTAQLGLDPQGLATLSAVFFYAFSLSQLPLALYLDRIGPRRSMLALNLAGISGALVFSAAQSLNTLIVARALLGIGMAGNLMGTFKLLSAWFSPRRFATLGGLVFSIGMGGSLLAATPLVALSQAVGWRVAFVLFAGLNLLLWVLLLVKVTDRPDSNGESAETSRSGLAGFSGLLRDGAALLGKRDYWIISLAAGCRYGIFAAIQTLYCGPYLMTVRGYSPLAAGNIVLAMMLGVIAGGPLFGWLSDEMFHSRKAVIIGGLWGMAFSLVMIAGLPARAGILAVAAGFILLGAFSSFTTILYTHIKEQVDPDQAGSAMTGVNFFTMLAPGICLQAMGLLMEWRHPDDPMGAAAFQDSYWICAAILAGVSLLYFYTRDTRADQ